MKKQFTIVFIVSLLVFGILFAVIDKNLSAKSDITDNEDITKEEPSNENDEKETEDKEDKDELLFLLLGVDAEHVEKSKGARTDTMMLTKVNMDTGKITILSIPRDTRIIIDNQTQKINAAHAFKGPEGSVQEVSELLGIKLDYYVKVDYNIVKEVVNAIGGVTVNVPFNMNYDDPTSKPPLHIRIKKGEQTLDGKNAHDFLRYRHNNNMTVGYPEGDVGRIKAQQYFMKELVKQTLKPANLLKLPKLVQSYFNNVETNVPLSYMLKGAMAASKIDVDAMETHTLPGEGKYVGKISYFLHEEAATKELVKELFPEYLK